MEPWMDMIQHDIHAELLVLVPVLYLLGVFLKKASFLADRWIPLTLAGVGIGLCVLYGLAASPVGSLQDVLLLLFTGFTQGILVSSTSVFCNQVYKQMKKEDASSKEDSDQENH